MATLHRFVWVTSFAVGAWAAVQCSTAEDSDATCSSDPQQQQQDHLLLQTKHAVKGAAAGKLREEASLATQEVPQCDNYLSVSRRRRVYEMRSCRRRHSSPGYDDTDSHSDPWTCDEGANEMKCDSTKAAVSAPTGYPASGAWKAPGLWCSIQSPPWHWHLKDCPFSSSDPHKTTIKVLTYNLYWWNLFGQHGGADRSAGKLIAWNNDGHGFDAIGFQECDSHHRIMEDARAEGLHGNWNSIDGGRALAIAYNADRWEVLSNGAEDVCEDKQGSQYYGKRRIQWARLKNKHDHKVVFFANHHGPLRVNHGGGCTGSACAMNLMRVIANTAHNTDLVVLLGDFNAGPGSSRVAELDRRLDKAMTGNIYGGIDHVYTNCAREISDAKNLGKGEGWRGSDHDALTVTLKF